jgi:spoIIIJ-associated protein
MDDPKRRFFSGDTLQQAVIQAANYFNLDPSYVAYRSLEKRHGFLKGRRKVVIEVDPDNPRRETPEPLPLTPVGRALPPPPPSSYLSREPAAPAGELRPSPPPAERPAGPRPERGERRERRRDRGDRGGREQRGGRREGRDRGGRERPGGRRGQDDEVRIPPTVRAIRGAEAPRSAPLEASGLVTLPETPRRVSERYPVATGPVAEAAVRAAELLIRIAGLDLAPQIFQGEDRLEVDLTGDDVDWCFADEGEFVMAIEHLLPRLIRSLCGEILPVRVDCDNFHEIREERLRSLAQRVAEEVRRRGRPRVLEPMNPADRRIVHVTLADDPGVVTESEGDGYFKRITIRPA